MALQRNPFLDALAQMSMARNAQPNQISYPLLAGELASNQRYYQAASIITTAIDAVRRRQAVLQALEDGGLTAEVRAWVASGARGDQVEPRMWPRASRLSELILAGDATNPESPIVRASHSGGIVDGQLPQGPYDPNLPVGSPPARAGGVAGPPVASTQGLVGPVNWTALIDTKDDHTTGVLPGGLAADPNRVASYFEITLSAIKDGVTNKNAVSGGRVVYDPFNQRYFVSEHYDMEFEVVQVPPYREHPSYQELLGNIQTFRTGRANITQQDWLKVIDRVYLKMKQGTY